jgi:DNA-directed RNA polymerase specialized sigma subunit
VWRQQSEGTGDRVKEQAMSKKPKSDAEVAEALHIGPRETIEMLVAANKLLDECQDDDDPRIAEAKAMIKQAKAMNMQARAVIKQAIKQAKAKLRQL